MGGHQLPGIGGGYLGSNSFPDTPPDTTPQVLPIFSPTPFPRPFTHRETWYSQFLCLGLTLLCQWVLCSTLPLAALNSALPGLPNELPLSFPSCGCSFCFLNIVGFFFIFFKNPSSGNSSGVSGRSKIWGTYSICHCNLNTTLEIWDPICPLKFSVGVPHSYGKFINSTYSADFAMCGRTPDTLLESGNTDVFKTWYHPHGYQLRRRDILTGMQY